MSVTLSVAYRNIKLHIHKTIILGGIITIGTFMILVGNSIIDTAQKGIEKNFTENYTGDVIISRSKSRNLSLFSSMNEDSLNNENLAIEGWDKIIEYLDSHNDVISYSPQLAGSGTLSQDNLPAIPVQMVSFNPKMYEETFPGNIIIIEGEAIDEEKGGILLNEISARMLKRMSKDEVKLGDTITISANSALGGTKIRELTWVGTYKFSSNTNADMQLLNIVDAKNLRAFTGLDQIITDVVLSSDESSFIGDISFEDDLFGEVEETEVVEAGTITTTGVDDLFEGFDPNASRKSDTNLYHFLLIKTFGDNSTLLKDLEVFLSENEIDSYAHNWLDGAGDNARTVYTIKTVFNVVILIIAFVALTIIMNTIVVSLMERISEIGTMRAIGAKRGFVSRLIVSETMLITLSFGFFGTVLGVVTIFIMQKVGLTASNYYLMILFGGETINPTISAGSIVLSLASLFIVGSLSSIYPVLLANKISPIKAIQKGGL